MPLVAPQGRLSTFQLSSFDGGLNLRDAPSQVAPNESPECMNVTLNERGGAESRLGIELLNAASLLPSAPIALYYSEVANALVAYCALEGDLYRSTDGGATWTTFFTTLTASALSKGSFVDFKDRLVFVNTLDGVYSFASDLASSVHTVGGTGNMEAVRGSAIAVWQNKCWVTGDRREDATHSRTRVWFSNAGNEQLWTIASAFVDIRDVNTKACTAIGAGTGMDVSGRPTLLVFKETSMYRIHDSTSGAYTTLHERGAGAASNQAVASNRGRICSINHEGIWVTDGLSIPVNVADKLQPLFTPQGVSHVSGDTWSAAPYLDRVVFSVRRAGVADNDLMLEYHPEIGWTVPHELGIGAMTTYTNQTETLIGAAAPSISSPDGQIYALFTGGTDAGLPISARYQTPWMPVASGDEGRLRYLRSFGRGAITMHVRTDFATNGETYPFTYGVATGFEWDVALWDVGAWGEPLLESDDTTPLDQVCKHVSLKFEATTTTSGTRPGLLGSELSPEVGAWAVYGVKLDYVQLGT